MTSINEILFPELPYRRSRTDSAFYDDIQEQMKGLESDVDGLTLRKDATASPSAQVTMTIHPSVGSTCISLYPRTKTFTYRSAIDAHTCLATSADGLWKITAAPAEGAPDNADISVDSARFTFERVGPAGDMSGSPGGSGEMYKNCRVRIAESSLPASPMSPSKESRFWMRPTVARRPSMVVT